MRKLPSGVATVLLVGLLLDVFSSNRTAIRHAQHEAALLESTRDSLVAVIWHREQHVAALQVTRDTIASLASRLRDSVDVLERSRAVAQLTVRQIRTVGALQDRLRKAFPELGKSRSAWGLTTIPIEPGDTIGIQYFVVPAWFAETFVIDHLNAKSWRAQKSRLLAVDSLRLRVTVLQDSIVRLQTANAKAWQAGYESAYQGYQDVSRRYLTELRKPRLSVGSTVGMLVGAGAGIVLGGVLHE